MFEKSYYDVELEGNRGEQIDIVKAVDSDIQLCDDQGVSVCPCGQVLYSLRTGNEDGMFGIDGSSGVITYYPSSDGNSVYNVRLVVAARNPGLSSLQAESTTEVHVTVHHKYG